MIKKKRSTLANDILRILYRKSEIYIKNTLKNFLLNIQNILTYLTKFLYYYYIYALTSIIKSGYR